MRLGLIAIFLYAVPQAGLSTPPTLPPADPARLAAAMEIMRAGELSASDLAGIARFRLREQVASMLDSAKVRRGGEAWYRKHKLLESHFWSRISASVESNRADFLGCAASRYAFMTMEDLHALRDFLSTDAGKAFWRTSGMVHHDFDRCSEVFLDDIAPHVGEAWKLIGAKPPPVVPDLA